MDEFNEADKGMIDTIKASPSEYTIYVDNDCMSVSKHDDPEFSYDFQEYGYYFAKQLLNYMGIDSEMV